MSVERYLAVAVFMIFSSMAIEKLLRGSRERDPLPHRGLEVHPGEADRGVAPDVHTELSRAPPASPPSRDRDVPELRRLAPADVAERRDRLPERRDLIARAAGVVRDDRVGDVDRMHEIPDQRYGDRASCPA